MPSSHSAVSHRVDTIKRLLVLSSVPRLQRFAQRCGQVCLLSAFSSQDGDDTIPRAERFVRALLRSQVASHSWTGCYDSIKEVARPLQYVLAAAKNDSWIWSRCDAFKNKKERKFMKATAETNLIIKREDADGFWMNRFLFTGCEFRWVAIDVFSPHIVRCFFASLLVFLILLVSSALSRASADERGMVGMVVRQIFSETEPNHRGVLAVMHVVEDSPAAKAGIHCSDFILAVNGTPVPGREFSEIVNKEISGPVGGTVRLTVARFDGSKSEITLVRTPIPPHANPPSDPFVYVVPGIWSSDPRAPFPLSWAPSLPYHGFVDLFFSPNFDRTDSPEYHSYVIFMSLEGTPALSAEQLQSDMLTWFRGLAVERGAAHKFTPDLSKVSVTYKEDPTTSRTPGGAATRAFSGTESIYDTHGKIITLNSEVRMISGCGKSNNTVFFFGMSPEPRDGDMWKQLDAIRDTFQCR